MTTKDESDEAPPTNESEAIAEIERDWISNTDFYLRLFKKTQNPMYAWRVLLLYCGRRKLDAILEIAEQRARIELPTWCCEYFLSTAFDLEALSRAEDIREPLPEIDGQRRNSVDATTAASLITPCLGISRTTGEKSFVRVSRPQTFWVR